MEPAFIFNLLENSPNRQNKPNQYTKTTTNRLPLPGDPPP